MRQADRIKVFITNIRQFKNDGKDTKRLYFEFEGAAYVLYITTHPVANLRNMGFPDSSPAFNEVLRDSTSMGRMVLVAVIERIGDKVVEAFEADAPDWNVKTTRPTVALHSAVLTEKRTLGDMVALEAAVKAETGKNLDQLDPAAFLFWFARMYATQRFSALVGDNPFAYKLLENIPKDISEIGIFVIWQFQQKDPKEEGV